ncbi:hypothetical protein VCV18_012354 [Metarhizium anisopliae]
MKFVILAGAATLVGALPQTKPAAAQKEPWISRKNASYHGMYCEFDSGRFAHSNIKCGTTVYCKAFDDQEWMKRKFGEDVKFKSANECFDAHDRKPAEEEVIKSPWIEEGSPEAFRCNPSNWADRCGTERRCQAFDDQRKYRQQWNSEPEYYSSKECLDAHGAKPDADRIVFPED